MLIDFGKNRAGAPLQEFLAKRNAELARFGRRSRHLGADNHRAGEIRDKAFQLDSAVFQPGMACNGNFAASFKDSEKPAFCAYSDACALVVQRSKPFTR